MEVIARKLRMAAILHHDRIVGCWEILAAVTAAFMPVVVTALSNWEAWTNQLSGANGKDQHLNVRL